MFSHEKRYKIRAKVHGNGGVLLTSRLAYAPLSDLTAVAGDKFYKHHNWLILRSYYFLMGKPSDKLCLMLRHIYNHIFIGKDIPLNQQSKVIGKKCNLTLT